MTDKPEKTSTRKQNTIAAICITGLAVGGDIILISGLVIDFPERDSPEYYTYGTIVGVGLIGGIIGLVALFAHFWNIDLPLGN